MVIKFLFLRIVFDVINMLQGVWIFVLFILFNPEAKGIFCGTTSTKDETEMRMNVLEDKDLLQNENEPIALNRKSFNVDGSNKLQNAL